MKMQIQKQRICAVASVMAAVFYLVVMITFGNDCTIAEQKLSEENAIINYVETQIGNQELPINSISSVISLCKSPIKTLSDDDFLTIVENTRHVSEFAYFAHPIRNTNARIFANTDIIFPFNCFW